MFLILSVLFASERSFSPKQEQDILYPRDNKTETLNLEPVQILNGHS